MPGWPKAGYGVTQRGGLRSSRCALTDVVGFRNSTGIASDVRDVRTATEAGVVVSWPGLFAWRGGPCENQSHWSWVGRSAGRSGCPVRPVQTPRPKGSPSIPARPHPLKNTGNFKDDEEFVSGLKPRLRLVSLAFGSVHGPKMQTPFVSRTSMRAVVAGTVSPCVVRRGLLTGASGTPAVATDLSATRTGRKDSRLSGPIDPDAPSAVAALPFVRRPRCPPPSFFRHT
jgi:hypothetical protein